MSLPDDSATDSATILQSFSDMFFDMSFTHMVKAPGKTIPIRIVVAVILLAAGLSHTGADSLQDDRGFDALVGTWIYTEYDGLFHHYEEATWKTDGMLIRHSSRTQSVSHCGPFRIVEKRSSRDGCSYLTIVDESNGAGSTFQIRISRCGDRYEICQSTAADGQECCSFIRKKTYRGTPRYRFDTFRDGNWYAGYPFNPDMVMPCTKYFWAKA
jgi:hypothetical protein